MPRRAYRATRATSSRPSRNVPRSAREHGHEVLSEETGPDGVTKLLIRRA